MTEADVRRIVAEMLGVTDGGNAVGVTFVTGAASRKVLGDTVAHAGMQHRIVVVDLSNVRTIVGRKPWWRA